MSESDKYPEESGRRRFVKGVVGGAALAGVGTTGAVALNSATTSPGAGGGTTVAMAIENTDGPAPRGMPQIPIEITSDGLLRGVWPEVKTITQNGIEVEIAETEDFKGTDVTYSSSWFQYCGLQSYGGIEPAYDSDNLFRSTASPPYQWQADAFNEGEPLDAQAFDGYEQWGNGIGRAGLGKPASGTWRSQEAEDVIPIQVIRSPIIEEKAKEDPWLQASTEKGFIAWLNKCTHFCCVPGYKQLAGSARFNAENDVYCPCHQSVYDPFTIVETQFTALPRPDDA